MQKIMIPFDTTNFALWHWPYTGDSARAPILHWAHATGFNGPTYAPLLAPLASRFHVYAWDARGHGSSVAMALPSALKNWHGHCDDLLRILEFIRTRHEAMPLILAGHSMGGTVSLLASVVLGDALSGLVLAEPVVQTRFIQFYAKFLNYISVSRHNHMMITQALKRKADWPDIQTMHSAYTGRGAFATWQSAFLEAYVAYGTHPQADGVRLVIQSRRH